MTDLFDSHPVDIPCPKCGHQIKERLGRLKNDAQLTCPGCQSRISSDAKGLRDGLESVDKSLAELKRSIAQFGK